MRRFSLLHRHPRPLAFSEYVEGELDIRDRQALEAHLVGCARCREILHSLETTIRALGSIREDSPASVADSVIAALQAESPPQLATPRPRSGLPALAVVPGPGGPPPVRRIRRPRSGAASAALRYCLRRAQLRFTLPIALIAGAVLTMVNMGGQLLDGRFDLGMCATCTVDFLVPFVLVNVGLLAILRAPGRKRP